MFISVIIKIVARTFDGHREYFTVNSLGQRIYDQHSEEHVRNERYNQYHDVLWVSLVLVHFHVRDDDEERHGHSGTRHCDGSFPFDVVQHGEYKTANNTRHAHEHSDREAIPLHPAVAEHVHGISRKNRNPVGIRRTR